MDHFAGLDVSPVAEQVIGGAVGEGAACAPSEGDGWLRFATGTLRSGLGFRQTPRSGGETYRAHQRDNCGLSLAETAITRSAYNRAWSQSDSVR
jgi:hypothetical protein